jgi:ABC-2 type transport system permease protein
VADRRGDRGGLVGCGDEGRVAVAQLRQGNGGQVLFLVRHEWRVLTANAIARLVIVVFGLALLAATALGISRDVRERATLQVFDARGGAGLGRTAPPSLRADVVANDRGSLALLPPAPLGALAVGQSDVHPNYIKITARSLDALVSGDQIEHPLAVASGQFDAAFVMLFLYPLLIFAVSFDLTAGERDRGTLRMVLSQPITLRQVVAGKMIVRALLLLVPAIIVPFAMVASNTPLDATSAQRAMLWALAVTAYAAIWHGLALVVNARGLSAAANALVLAGIWLLFVVVGPSAVNLLIATRYPMPSRVEAAVQARAATQDATVQGSRELGQFLQDHPTSGSVGREGMRQFALLQAQRDQRVADRLQSVEAEFNDQLQRQQRLAAWLSVLSPTMIAQGVLLDVAGTSTYRFAHFRSEALAFQRDWRAYFEPRVLDAATLTPQEYAAAPVFAYRDEAPSLMRRRIALPIAMMIGLALLLWWAGFRTYKGYQL